MLSIPQSTAYLCVFKAFLASDHITEATGKTIAITISKNGGAFGNPNAGATNATEITSGWYKVSLDTTDTNTVGPIAIRGAVATIDDVGTWVTVVKATNGGMTALPDAAAEAAGGLYTRGSGAGQIAQQANGQSDVNLSTIKTQAVTCAAGVTVLASVGTAATSTAQTGDNFARLGAPAGASVSADIVAINAKTTNLPAAPASTTNITAGTITTTTNLTNAAGVTSNIKKNSASRITFVMTDSTTHAPKTGCTVTAQVSLDGAALGSCVNSPSEIGSGLYTLVLAAGDTNANELACRFTASSADDLIIERVTQP